MRKILIVALAALSAPAAYAQLPEGVQRSSSPQGVQIQGDTAVKANATNVTAVAAGKDNTARNTAGAVNNGVQIQGNTKINATAKNVNAVAVGQKNKADNTVGAIGGQ
jgi:hypothetical protein